MIDVRRADGLYAALLRPGLRELAAKGVLRRYRRGDLIVREGDANDEFFIVLNGLVESFSRDESNREMIYTRLDPGEFFGEVNLDGGTRPASVRALAATTCAVVTHRTLLMYCADNPDFTAELIRTLSARVRGLTIVVKELALHSVDRRIGALLERMAVDDQGVRLIPDRLTHQEIAGYVGASREMVSKVLKEMTAAGLLDRRDGRIVLLKPLAPER